MNTIGAKPSALKIYLDLFSIHMKRCSLECITVSNYDLSVELAYRGIELGTWLQIQGVRYE